MGVTCLKRKLWCVELLAERIFDVCSYRLKKSVSVRSYN